MGTRSPPARRMGPGVFLVHVNKGPLWTLSEYIAMDLLPFQQQFLAAVANPKYDVVILSGPRGLGKTFLAAKVLERCMTPGDPLHQPGKEFILGAASLEQCRLTYQFIRQVLEPTAQYRWIDSTTRLGATHPKSNTKLRAISSNAKTSLGLVGVPTVCLDEPGALEVVGGQMLSDSLFTAQGKPGSKLKIIMCGTLAPMATRAGHWWFDTVMAGTQGSVHVQLFQGNLETWDSWQTIRQCNPLAAVDAGFRKKLLAERDAARRDGRLKARFLSYRLNLPSRDEAEMLLTVDDWEIVTAREVPERAGRPVVSVDLGAGKAWSSATAVWRNGRSESFAICQGIPPVKGLEKRDHVPAGTYQKLVDAGSLLVATGLRVPPVGMLVKEMKRRWGRPRSLHVDRFRISELRDAVGDLCEIIPRVTRWSESSEDIRSLRRGARDGPLSVSPCSRSLLTASLAAAQVLNDDAGSFRLIKRGSNNTGRDDVAASWLLSAGARDRLPPPVKTVYHSVIVN